MNSPNEHYKNDPSCKNGSPNRRIDDALIESVSGNIADMQPIHLTRIDTGRVEYVTRRAQAATRFVRRQRTAGLETKEGEDDAGAEKQEKADTGANLEKSGKHDEKLTVS